MVDLCSSARQFKKRHFLFFPLSITFLVPRSRFEESLDSQGLVQIDPIIGSLERKKKYQWSMYEAEDSSRRGDSRPLVTLDTNGNQRRLSAEG